MNLSIWGWKGEEDGKSWRGESWEELEGLKKGQSNILIKYLNCTVESKNFIIFLLTFFWLRTMSINFWYLILLFLVLWRVWKIIFYFFWVYNIILPFPLPFATSKLSHIPLLSLFKNSWLLFSLIVATYIYVYVYVLINIQVQSALLI